MNVSVALFNGMSTFMFYVMPKSSLRDSSGGIKPIAMGNKGIHTFPRGYYFRK